MIGKARSGNYPDALQVGIDARAITAQPAGKGRYTLGLLEGWTEKFPADHLTIFTTQGFRRPASWPSHWQVVTVASSVTGSIAIDRVARKRGIQALLAPGNYSLAVVAQTPTVTVVHDIAVFVVPEARPSLKVRLAEQLLLKACLRRSAKVMAVSEFTKEELTRYFGLSPAKVGVAPNAVAESFRPASPNTNRARAEVKKRYGLPDKFFLFVSTLEPRKNLVRLLKAYADLAPVQQQACPLIVAGRLGWSTAKIVTELMPLERTGVVRRLDYVTNDDLPLLYQLAWAVLFPSLYEGFGLPALEALASGVPLLTSQTSSLPEVVGEAALLVDPIKIDSIKDGLRRLLTDAKLRAELAKRGPAQAEKYTWAKTATALRVAVENISRPS
jgi:glycosyltransferase involved in cell wall biosynthesis